MIIDRCNPILDPVICQPSTELSRENSHKIGNSFGKVKFPISLVFPSESKVKEERAERVRCVSSSSSSSFSTTEFRCNSSVSF